MNRIILTITGIAMASSAMAMPADVVFSYAQDDIGSWGTSRKERYDVAIRITDPALAGKKISSVKVLLNTAEGLSAGSVWLSEELTLTDKTNCPDIISCESEIVPVYDGHMHYAEMETDFSIPYEITGKGVYVGYSFTVDGELNDLTRNPLLLTSSEHSDAFYLHTTTQVRNWTDYHDSRLAATPVIYVTLSGDFHESAVGILEMQDDIYIEADKTGEISLSLANHGIRAIESIDYTYAIEGNTWTGHKVFDEPLYPNPACIYETAIPIEPLSEIGTFGLDLKIDRVNGIQNEDMLDSGSAVIHISPLTPVRRTVMEEFTGAWCQWCPKGWLAMKMMNELHPDEFIGLAYHYDDPMMSISEFPVDVYGFPSAYLDRMESIDPYDGSGEYDGDMAIEKDWLEARQKPTNVDIRAEASWIDDSHSAIGVKSTTLFVADYDDIDYRLSYILVQDGMKGRGSLWFQKNAYSGTTETGYLAKLCDMPSIITDMTYDDVVIISREMKGIEGSLPGTVRIGDEVGHSYLFNLADAKSTSNDSRGEYLIQDIDRLSVVVMVIDSKTNRIMNACKTAVPMSGSGMETVDGYPGVISETLYDLAGNKVDRGYKGFTIKRSILSDGTVRTSKILNR